MIKNKKYLFLCIIITAIFSNNSSFIGSDGFLTDSDGIIKMQVNVLGHVNKPGTFLMHDGIDIMSALSMAQGYKTGANLKNVVIYHKNGQSTKLNFNDILNQKDQLSQFKLKPHDTIYIKQKKFDRFINSTNIPGIILSMLNIAIVLERTD